MTNLESLLQNWKPSQKKEGQRKSLQNVSNALTKNAEKPMPRL